MVFENAKSLYLRRSRYDTHRFSKPSDFEKPRCILLSAPNFPVFRSSATQPPSKEIFDFRIAKLQRYIHRCHKEGRPVPSVYSPIERDLSEENVRAWLEQRDRITANLKDVIRHIENQPDDSKLTA